MATLWLPGKGGEKRATWLPCSYLEEEESRELSCYPLATWKRRRVESYLATL
jgi:hypothetical protein